LVGEIYVRQDPFCQGELLRHLESRGFLVRIAPMSEWLGYLAYLLRLKPIGFRPGPLKFLKLKAVAAAMQRLEKGVRRSFAGSGLCWEEAIEVDRTVRHSMHLMSAHLYGEAILTVGLALREILHSACGVISIGPFGCMPSRLAEGLLVNRMSTAGLEGIRELPAWPEGDLPFLAIETDGSPFPQLVQARLEAFCLQADKAHALMQAGLAHRTA
jgi:predicted nucleotide-binding protein (sugar kinase/HSP70/actin superfamily)